MLRADRRSVFSSFGAFNTGDTDLFTARQSYPFHLLILSDLYDFGPCDPTNLSRPLCLSSYAHRIPYSLNMCRSAPSSPVHDPALICIDFLDGDAISLGDHSPVKTGS